MLPYYNGQNAFVSDEGGITAVLVGVARGPGGLCGLLFCGLGRDRTKRKNIFRYILNYDVSEYISEIMKHRHGHAGGRHRQFFSPDGVEGFSHPRRPHHRHEGGRRGGRHRLFDYGEIRLLVLGLIAEKPTYGYELIRVIGEKFGGSYTPSPGVIYPTLTWLDEAGYVTLAEAEGRKSYHLTPQGQAFLDANRAALEEIEARALQNGGQDQAGRGGVPVSVARAMENLRTALRLRLRHGGLDAEAAEKVAALLDGAAQAVGRV